MSFWRSCPKRVLKVIYLLGTAAHLVTHHMSWLGQQQKFRVLHFIFSEKEKPMTCVPAPFLFPMYEYPPVHQWSTSTNIPLRTLSLAPSTPSWLTTSPSELRPRHMESFFTVFIFFPQCKSFFRFTSLKNLKHWMVSGAGKWYTAKKCRPGKTSGGIKEG